MLPLQRGDGGGKSGGRAGPHESYAENFILPLDTGEWSPGCFYCTNKAMRQRDTACNQFLSIKILTFTLLYVTGMVIWSSRGGGKPHIPNQFDERKDVLQNGCMDMDQSF